MHTWTRPDPIVLRPRAARALAAFIDDVADMAERLEGAERTAEAAGHPAFSKKALRRWVQLGDAARDARLVLLDASAEPWSGAG